MYIFFIEPDQVDYSKLFPSNLFDQDNKLQQNNEQFMFSFENTNKEGKFISEVKQFEYSNKQDSIFPTIFNKKSENLLTVNSNCC